MSSGSTEREIRDRLEDVAGAEGPTAIEVSWGDADPDARPDGMSWDPGDDDEPARLQYDLWDAQKETLEAIGDGPDICAFLAGYGSGKSIFGARWVIKTALETPGGRFLVLGQSFAEARDTTFSKFFEQLPGDRTALRTSGYNGPETSPIVRDYNRQERRVTLVNDATIVLGSADKASRFAGAEFSGIWADEPSHYGDKLHDLTDMLTTRLRGVDGPKLMVWTLTGEGYNAAWEILSQREGPDGEPIGLDIELIQASVLNNPYLAEEDKERFRRKYEGTSKEEQALHGSFVETSGKLLSLDSLTFIDVDEIPGEDFEVHIGVDLGFVGSHDRAVANDTDYTAVVLAYISHDTRQVYLADCDRQRGLSLQETISWLSHIEGKIGHPIVWKIEDVAGSKYAVQEARRQLRGKIYPVTPSGSKSDRILDMSVLFENENVVLVNRDDHDETDPRPYDDEWRDWVDEWTQFGTEDTHDDLLDATFYALENLKTRTPAEGYDPYDR